MAKTVVMTPVYSYLVICGWHGATATQVVTVAATPHRYRIRAITRTRLAGRARWLEPGQEALVPKTAVRHGHWSVPVESLRSEVTVGGGSDASEEPSEARRG